MNKSERVLLQAMTSLGLRCCRNLLRHDRGLPVIKKCHNISCHELIQPDAKKARLQKLDIPLCETRSTLLSCTWPNERSKGLASLFCVRSRDSPGFEPSHGAHWQSTLVVDGGRSTPAVTWPTRPAAT